MYLIHYFRWFLLLKIDTLVDDFLQALVLADFNAFQATLCHAQLTGNRRIVSYVTVVATQKTSKKTSKMGVLFVVRCLTIQRDHQHITTRMVLHRMRS